MFFQDSSEDKKLLIKNKLVSTLIQKCSILCEQNFQVLNFLYKNKEYNNDLKLYEKIYNLLYDEDIDLLQLKISMLFYQKNKMKFCFNADETRNKTSEIFFEQSKIFFS